MKKLFDILDDRLCGFVKFSDIEKGWQDDGCKGLPRGVIESLRKVTPASGLLSFERFCAGLKICLLRNQALDSERRCLVQARLPFKSQRPPSAPLLEIENPMPSAPWNAAGHSAMAAVRPQNVAITKRAHSLPHLSPDFDVGADMPNDINISGAINRPLLTTFSSPSPPPKPPRSGVTAKGSSNTSSRFTKPAAAPDKQEIRHALQNWQMGVLLHEMDNTNDNMQWKQFPPSRGCADGGSTSTNDSGASSYIKKSNSECKRREPRRHTLQSGIDYNMLKRLKQYEEERAVLLLGLNAVEKAREWYMHKLNAVQQKVQHLGRMGDSQDQWSEVQREHLNFQRARVLEVNRNLATLAETWERAGFPTHFNLALSSAPTLYSSNGGSLLDPVVRLRQQNRHLTDEVSLKSDRIAMLEGEKKTLLRELYLLQQRAPLSVAGRSVADDLIGVLGQASPVCSSSSGGLGDVDVVY